MQQCSICAQHKSSSDLRSTYIITKDEETRDINACHWCINKIFDKPMGEWFQLNTTDEAVRFPNAFYARL